MRKFILTVAMIVLIPLTVGATPLTFTYDALGRMTVFTLPAGNQVTYSYDANGNRTQEKIIIQAAFDPDADAIPTVADNCSAKSNSAQSDVDNDGKGDSCDFLNWAQLITGYYNNYGNQDGITTEQLMTNHGLSNISQIGSISNYTDALNSNREVTGVAYDPSSNRIYFSESWPSVVRHVDLGTNQVSSDAGAGSVWLRGYVDGTGTNAKMNKPEQIAVSSDGTWIYIPDYANCAIRRMNTATGAVTTYAGDPATIPCNGDYNSPSTATYKDGAAATARFFWPRAVAVDSDGTVYVGDSGNHAVRKISTGGIVSTVAGGPANTIGMIRPDGIAIIGSDLYVADRLARVVWRINKNTGSASVVIGKLNTPGLNAGVAGDQARLMCPLAIAGSGTQLFLTDDCNNAIFQIDISNNHMVTLLNPIQTAGFVDGPLSAAKFNIVQGISYDPELQLVYVADFANMALRRINLSTLTVSTILGLPSITTTYVDGDGLVARFNMPLDIARIDDTAILVTDAQNCLLRKVTLDPQYGQVVGGKYNHTVTVSTLAGQQSICTTWNLNAEAIDKSDPVSTADAPDGATAKFYWPTHLTVDSAAQFAYVTSLDRTIRRVTLSTGATTWIAGSPLATEAVDGITGSAQFDLMHDVVYVDEPAAGGGTTPALYVLQFTAIRRVSLNAADYGTVTTPYGDLSASGTQDGTGTSARFTKLGRATVLSRGGVPHLFVTDYTANTIRQINLSTKQVTTLAGSGNAASVDGNGLAASFDGPLGIVAVTFPENVAYLYVGDTHNTPKLRVVDPDTLQVTTAAGSGKINIKDGIGGAADWASLSEMTYLPTKNRVFILDSLAQSIRQVTPDLPK